MERTDHREYREKIVNSAQKIFSHFGFEKTTMKDIARALRVGKSTLYYYFKNKISIFEAVLEKEAESIRKEIYTALEKETKPENKLRVYIELRMRCIVRSLRFYSILRNEYFRNYDLIESFRQKFDKEEKDIIIEILAQGIEQKVFKKLNKENLADSLLFMLKACEIKCWLEEMSVQKIDKILDEFADVFIKGCMKK
jgi:AcrR family transcriptional regulator